VRRIGGSKWREILHGSVKKVSCFFVLVFFFFLCQEFPDLVCGVFFEWFEVVGWCESFVFWDHDRLWPDEYGFDEDLIGFSHEGFDPHLSGEGFFAGLLVRGHDEPQSASRDGSLAEGFEVAGVLAEPVFPYIFERVAAAAIEVVYLGGGADDLVLLSGEGGLVRDAGGFGLAGECAEVAG